MVQRSVALTLQIGGALASSATRAFGGVARLLDGTGKQIDRLEDSQRDLRRELVRVRRAQKQAFDADEIADYRREVERLETALADTTKRLDAVSQQRQRAFGRAGRAAGIAGAGIGIGVAGITAGLGVYRSETERAREIQRAGRTSGVGTTAVQEIANFGVAGGILEQEQAVERAADIARELRNRLGEAVTDQSGATFDILQRLGLDAATLQGELANNPLQTILSLTTAIQEGLGESAQFGFEEVFGGAEGEIIAGFAALTQSERELASERAARRPLFTPEELDMLEAADQATKDLTGAFGNLTKELAVALAPAIVSIAERVTPIVQGFVDWTKENPALAKTIAIVAGGILAAVTAIAGITAAVFAFQAVWVAFNVLFAATPIGFIITGIVAAVALLVGIGYLLYRNWDTIMAAMATGVQYLKDTWDGLVVSIVNAARNILVPIFETVIGLINSAIQQFNRLPFVDLGEGFDANALSNALNTVEDRATFSDTPSETTITNNITLEGIMSEDVPDATADAVNASLIGATI